jgi:nicotinamide mononucleotide transporter
MLALEISSALLNGGYALGLAIGRRWAWPLGFFGTLAGVAVLFDAKLYAESLLNLGYAVLAVLGWVRWGRAAFKPLVGSLTNDFIVSVGLALATAYLMNAATDNPRPLADGIMFAGGILGTWWQVKRERLNWIIWITLNGVGVWLYADRGLWVYVAYSAVMAVVSVWGWFRWAEPFKKSKASAQ